MVAMGGTSAKAGGQLGPGPRSPDEVENEELSGVAGGGPAASGAGAAAASSPQEGVMEGKVVL
jgi:hypothetical protein